MINAFLRLDYYKLDRRSISTYYIVKIFVFQTLFNGVGFHTSMAQVSVKHIELCQVTHINKLQLLELCIILTLFKLSIFCEPLKLGHTITHACDARGTLTDNRHSLSVATI